MPRSSDEKIAILVPKWQIETWILYLEGKTVNENVKQSHFNNIARSLPAAQKLAQPPCLLPSPVLPSLQAACPEIQRICPNMICETVA